MSYDSTTAAAHPAEVTSVGHRETDVAEAIPGATNAEPAMIADATSVVSATVQGLSVQLAIDAQNLRLQLAVHLHDLAGSSTPHPR